VLASAFWDTDGILLVDYLEKGAMITAKYFVATGFQTSRQGNSASHKVASTCQKLADLHFEVLKHST
jgi:hypothetical protein